MGQTERLRRTMVLQHLFEHGIRRGFCLIHECHSAFLGAGRASRMLEEGVPGTPHPTPGRCAMCCSAPRMEHARLPVQTGADRSMVVVERDQRGVVRTMS